MGSPFNAPKAQPSESRTLIFSASRAAGERSSQAARSTKEANCSERVWYCSSPMAAIEEVRAIAHLLPFPAGSTSFGLSGAALRSFSL